MKAEAYAAYDSSLVYNPNNIGTLNNYAYYLSVERTNLDKAEEMSYKTVKAEPENATYLDTYAWILFEKKRYTEARIYIEQAMKKAKADIEYQACVQAFDRDDFRESLDHFFTAIHSRYDIEKPAIKRLICSKLNIISRLKRENEQLKRQMTAQRKQMQQYAHEYYELGNASILQAHNLRAALANYDKALSLDPSHVDAWIRKGVTLQDQGEYEDALQCFNRAAELSTANFKVHYNRGKNHLLCERTEQAVADFDKAVSLKPEHAKAHELSETPCPVPARKKKQPSIGPLQKRFGKSARGVNLS